MARFRYGNRNRCAQQFVQARGPAVPPQSSVVRRAMMTTRDHVLYLRNPGPRPAYYLVADHLWGVGRNVDSDGNSRGPDDTEWTELSLLLRGAPASERLDIDPVSSNPLTLEIRSPSQLLCERVARYLASVTGGQIANTA